MQGTNYYDEKDLSKRFCKVFNLPEAQALVMKDSDDSGMPTVSITFHLPRFGNMTLHYWPNEGEDYDKLFRKCSKNSDLVKEALRTVLAEVNLLADQQRQANQPTEELNVENIEDENQDA